jgi:hypothetical protein
LRRHVATPPASLPTPFSAIYAVGLVRGRTVWGDESARGRRSPSPVDDRGIDTIIAFVASPMGTHSTPDTHLSPDNGTMTRCWQSLIAAFETPDAISLRLFSFFLFSLLFSLFFLFSFLFFFIFSRLYGIVILCHVVVVLSFRRRLSHSGSEGPKAEFLESESAPDIGDAIASTKLTVHEIQC